MRFVFALLIALGISSATKTVYAQEVSAYNLTLQMIEKTLSISEMSFDMKKTERIDDEYITESFRTKLSCEPFKVYSKKIEADKTPELLYKDGWNDNKALINPDGFPWFNLSFDPSNHFMRRGQHHTLRETGYRYAISVLKFLFEKYNVEDEGMSKYLPSETVNNVDCWLIQFDNKYYKTVNYTVKEGEDVVDIAKKLYLSEFKILEYNDDVDDYHDVSPGQVIKICNDYSPKMIMAIDKKRLIPISIKVYDENGLFEQYEYSNVVIESGFKEEEFSEEFAQYGF